MRRKKEREIFELDGIKYFVDSLPEKGKQLLSDINAIEKTAIEYKVKMEIATIAKNSLGKMLYEFKDKLEEVPGKVLKST